jgi:hypothetical protein
VGGRRAAERVAMVYTDRHREGAFFQFDGAEG